MIEIRYIGRNILRIFKGRAKQPDEITLLEVKKIYALAHEHRAKARVALKQYRRIIRLAEALDDAYKAQGRGQAARGAA
jgi:hypothetical protein